MIIFWLTFRSFFLESLGIRQVSAFLWERPYPLECWAISPDWLAFCNVQNAWFITIINQPGNNLTFKKTTQIHSFHYCMQTIFLSFEFLLSNFPWFYVSIDDFSNRKSGYKRTKKRKEFRKLHNLFCWVLTRNDLRIFKEIAPSRIAFFLTPKSLHKRRSWTNTDINTPRKLVFDSHHNVIFSALIIFIITSEASSIANHYFESRFFSIDFGTFRRVHLLTILAPFLFLYFV